MFVGLFLCQIGFRESCESHVRGWLILGLRFAEPCSPVWHVCSTVVVATHLGDGHLVVPGHEAGCFDVVVGPLLWGLWFGLAHSLLCGGEGCVRCWAVLGCLDGSRVPGAVPWVPGSAARYH